MKIFGEPPLWFLLCSVRRAAAQQLGEAPGKLAVRISASSDSALRCHLGSRRRASRRIALEEKLKDSLRHFGQVLAEALSDSNEVHDALRKIHQQGYRLCLVIDCEELDAEEDDAESQASSVDLPLRPKARRASPDPAFQIDTSDLSFLRSIGIDPTRRSRRRRS